MDDVLIEETIRMVNYDRIPRFLTFTITPSRNEAGINYYKIPRKFDILQDVRTNPKDSNLSFKFMFNGLVIGETCQKGFERLPHPIHIYTAIYQNTEILTEASSIDITVGFLTQSIKDKMLKNTYNKDVYDGRYWIYSAGSIVPIWFYFPIREDYQNE